jgi:hypothetical protein
MQMMLTAVAKFCSPGIAPGPRALVGAPRVGALAAYAPLIAASAPSARLLFSGTNLLAVNVAP